MKVRVVEASVTRHPIFVGKRSPVDDLLGKACAFVEHMECEMKQVQTLCIPFLKQKAIERPHCIIPGQPLPGPDPDERLHKSGNRLQKGPHKPCAVMSAILLRCLEVIEFPKQTVPFNALSI